jgi:hypothetical protein
MHSQVQEAQKRRPEEQSRRTQGAKQERAGHTHSKEGDPPKRRARPQLPVAPKPKRCQRLESMESQGATGNSEDH